MIATMRRFLASGRSSRYATIHVGSRSLQGQRAPPPCSTPLVSGRSPEPSGLLYGTVVVAVATVSVMEVAVHQVVHVIAVRHGFVPAIGTVNVGGVVPLASVVRSAVRGVGPVDLETVLVHVVLVGMVQVAAVEVIDVVPVLDRDVTAVGAVGVIVVGMLFAAHRQDSSSPACSSTPWTSSAT